MSDYSITFARSARQELEKLDSPTVSRIFPKIESLVETPRPQGCKKLKGKKNLWRIRIGDFRVLYTIQEKEKIIDIIGILHRRESYR
ncbi:type II toxin-antitoxin system RelE/ParE family toxin [Nitrospina gracilis]|nr:type II toxin-antitoxin system RelE/ParE family toxin [Nitrospinaceae bacterium]MBN4077950.1 type II toxin-antitoxin system RelE/ParE family toxin [Nitrospina gracilis]